MRITSVLATLAAGASAVPMMMQIAATGDYKWDVMNANFESNSSSYSFNISGSATDSKPAKPAFMAECGGQGVDSPYRLCSFFDESDTTRRIATKLLPSNHTGVGSIQVSYQYIDMQSSTTWWNYTGSAVAPYDKPGMNFTIEPDTIYGVA